MTTLDELRSDLIRLADRGNRRSASVVYREALSSVGQVSDRPAPEHRRARILVGVAAALCLAASAIGIAMWTSGETNQVETIDQPTPLAPSITVNGGDPVRQVTIAFGRIWVADLDEAANSTTVHAYDPSTGRAVGTVRAPGPSAPDLVGDAYQIVATNHSLWIRTSTGGPAIADYDGADNVVYEVDPSRLTAAPRQYLRGDGQLVAHGNRVAAADFTHVEAVAEGGEAVFSRTTDEVVGIDEATVPGTNGLGRMRFDDDGLWLTHEGRNLVVRLDPTTGEAQGRADFADAAELRTSDESIWWIRTVPARGRMEGAIADGQGVRAVQVPFDGGRNLLDAIDATHLLVDRPYAIYDTQHRSLRSLDVADSEIAALVHLGNTPWLARWGAPADGRTIVRFTPIDTTGDQIVDDGDPAAEPRVEIHPPGSEALTVHLTQQALITPDQEHTVMHQVGFQVGGYGYDAVVYESDRSPLDPCSQVQPCIEVRPAVRTASDLVVRSWAPVLIPGGPTPTVATNLTLEGDGWTLAMPARMFEAPIEPFDLLTSAELPGPLAQITFQTAQGEATATAYATTVTAIGPDDGARWQLYLSFGCSPADDACIDDVGVNSGQVDADTPTIPATELVTAIR